jgi:transposase
VKQVVEDRRLGMSLTGVAKRHANSRASVCRWMKEFNGNSLAEEILRSGRNTVAQVSL